MHSNALKAKVLLHVGEKRRDFSRVEAIIIEIP